MPLEIVWSALARKRLDEIREYVEADKPEAAERLITRLVASVEVLRNFPRLGRPGAQPGLRELVIAGTPYILTYRIRGKRVIVTTIWHGAQRRR